MRELTKETEWSRTYRLAPGQFFYESKFLADKIEVDADKLINRWPDLSTSERHDFALAFQTKQEFSSGDIRILEFLTRAGDETVRRTICLALCRVGNRATAVDFILAMLKQAKGARSNYYQAASILGDPRFVPVLEDQLKELRDQLPVNLSLAPQAIQFRLELVHLSKALWTLTTNPEYKKTIENLVDDASEIVRNSVKMCMTGM